MQIIMSVFVHGISTARKSLAEIAFDEISFQQGSDCWQRGGDNATNSFQATFWLI